MPLTAKDNGDGAPDHVRLLSARRVGELADASDHEVPRKRGDRADPVSLTPHDRLRELAAILASGVHRLRAIPPAPPEVRGTPAESSEAGLEPVATTRPDGTGRQPERTPEA